MWSWESRVQVPSLTLPGKALVRELTRAFAVSGTAAGGRSGPDLTHFGGRATIAAGILRNTPSSLYAWLRDPQDYKPGANMPKVELSTTERWQLVAYLEGLK